MADPLTGEIVGIGPLAAALAKAQAAFPPVTRSKTVTVTTKTGASYKFSYAPLEAILDAVRKPLGDNGLALAQMLDDGALVTMLLHESGASIEGRIAIPGTNDVQALGSAITYLRRYAIQAMLGIAAEEDDDGNSAKSAAPKQSDKPRREYGKAPFPADERPETSETPIPESAPPPKPTLVPMVQCESHLWVDGNKGPQCRLQQGHQSKHTDGRDTWAA